ARVAAQLREDRHDLVGEVDRQVHVAALGRDGHPDELVAVDGDQFGGAVADRHDAAGGADAGHLRVNDFEFHVAGEVLQLVAVGGGGEGDLLGVVGALWGGFRRGGGRAPGP